MSGLAWISGALAAARPQAVGALLRYFRDLDLAEEAFQEAALRALKSWPQNGPPRDPGAWLILVGGNAALGGGGRSRLRPDRAADRPRFPGRRSGDGAAHHPCQGPHRPRRRALRSAGSGRARGT